MNDYEEVRDRANALVERLEAFDSDDDENVISVAWLIDEVCHLRGAFIDQAFALRDALAGAEKAEAEVELHRLRAEAAEARETPWRLGCDVALADAEKAEAALARRTAERDRARVWASRHHGASCREGWPCNCERLAALADEPEAP